MSNCSQAGFVPPLELKLTASVTFEPGDPEPDERLSTGVCAIAPSTARQNKAMTNISARIRTRINRFGSFISGCRTLGA
jgi:hypothetical protein